MKIKKKNHGIRSGSVSFIKDKLYIIKVLHIKKTDIQNRHDGYNLIFSKHPVFLKTYSLNKIKKKSDIVDFGYKDICPKQAW